MTHTNMEMNREENDITTTTVTKTDEEIKSSFLQELQEAREFISAEGYDVGLCEHCKDTGFIYLEKDGYSGIQAQYENEILSYAKCFHGEEIDSDEFLF